MDSPWDNMYEKDPWSRERVIRSVRLLLPHLKDGDTVLDVGCFTQEARKYLPSTIKYIGVDSKAFKPDTIVCDLNYDFPPMKVTHALCMETLEHLSNPSKTLRSLLQSIDDHGFLVLSLPNEATIFHRLRGVFLGIVDSECFAEEGKHLHLPSLSQCQQWFHRLGLYVESQKFYISPLACNSRQAWVGQILSLIPIPIHYFLARTWPSLFARGFIFLLRRNPLS